MNEHLVRDFQDLLSAPEEWQPCPTDFSFERLDAAEVSRLEDPFAKEEVLSALGEFSGDKAPRPNGFSVAFWQNSWDL